MQHRNPDFGGVGWVLGLGLVFERFRASYPKASIEISNVLPNIFCKLEGGVKHLTDPESLEKQPEFSFQREIKGCQNFSVPYRLPYHWYPHFYKFLEVLRFK